MYQYARFAPHHFSVVSEIGAEFPDFNDWFVKVIDEFQMTFP